MIDIQTGITAVLASKKRSFPQHVNRISSMDDPCLRKLYYMRAAWDKASGITDGLQGVFETGNILESVISRIVSEVGDASIPQWRIVGTQLTTNDNLLAQYQISGTIDGILQVNNGGGRWETAGVVDIKTMSPNIYPRINNYDDLSRYSWTRKYRGQLMLYALAHNMEQCFILAVNKNNLYEMKMIQFPLDMAYCDTLLEKARLINDAVATNTPPVGIDDGDTCPQCQFVSYCCPDYTTGRELVISDNAELEAVLDRLDELQEVMAEAKDLEKARDALLTKGHDTACGRWVVIWKKIVKNMKATPATTREEWRKTITHG